MDCHCSKLQAEEKRRWGRHARAKGRGEAGGVGNAGSNGNGNEEGGDLRDRAEVCFRKRRDSPSNGANDRLPHESSAMAS